METNKTDKTNAAEAENLETMDLLGGMLDNATRCENSTNDEKPASEESGKIASQQPR